MKKVLFLLLILAVVAPAQVVLKGSGQTLFDTSNDTITIKSKYNVMSLASKNLVVGSIRADSIDVRITVIEVDSSDAIKSDSINVNDLFLVDRFGKVVAAGIDGTPIGVTTASSGKFTSIGIGITPTSLLHVYQASPTADQILYNIGTSDDASRFSVDEDGDVLADGKLVSGQLEVNGTSVFYNPVYLHSIVCSTNNGPLNFGVRYDGTYYTDRMMLSMDGLTVTGDVDATGTVTADSLDIDGGVLRVSDAKDSVSVVGKMVVSTYIDADSLNADHLVINTSASLPGGSLEASDITLAENSVLVGNASDQAAAGTDLPTATTIGSGYIYRAGGTDVPDGDVANDITASNYVLLTAVEDSVEANAYYPGGTDVADADVVDTITAENYLLLTAVEDSVEANAYYPGGTDVADDDVVDTITAENYLLLTAVEDSVEANAYHPGGTDVADDDVVDGITASNYVLLTAVEDSVQDNAYYPGGTDVADDDVVDTITAENYLLLTAFDDSLAANPTTEFDYAQVNDSLIFHQDNLGHGMTTITDTDNYAHFRTNDGSEGGLTVYGFSTGAGGDDSAISLRAVTTETTPSYYPFVFAVGTKTIKTWSGLSAGRHGFLWTNGSSKLMALNTSGWLGIGTEAPAHKLHVDGGNIALGDSTTGDHDGIIYFADDGNCAAESFKWDDGEGKFIASDDLAVEGFSASGDASVGGELAITDSLQVGAGDFIRKTFISADGLSIGFVYYNPVLTRVDTVYAVQPQ